MPSSNEPAFPAARRNEEEMDSCLVCATIETDVAMTAAAPAPLRSAEVEFLLCIVIRKIGDSLVSYQALVSGYHQAEISCEYTFPRSSTMRTVQVKGDS